MNIEKQIEEIKEYINEYQREWRRKNPERARDHQESYWERLAAKQLKKEGDR